MGKHPLENFGIKISNFRCFGEEFEGWDRFSPINIAVGRNNSGKSALIDILKFAITEGKSFKSGRHGRSNKLPEIRIEMPIPDNVTQYAGVPAGFFSDKRIVISGKTNAEQKFVGFSSALPQQPHISSVNLESLAKNIRHDLPSLDVIVVSAERDIRPESRNGEQLELQSVGSGVTNMVRAFQNSENLPSDLINGKLRQDLNFIYQGDCEFKEILCQESDTEDWEIFLQEEKKGNIRLSDSGSSLKTVFIILAFLILRPKLGSFSWSNLIFCVEEPENNLHPALLRRLLEYLASQRDTHKFTLIITSHSPICIDWASKREDSQIVHVQHDGDCSTVSQSLGYADNRDIIDDLDFRASDILQANGIIWVEGPSDRIYLKKWIELGCGLI